MTSIGDVGSDGDGTQTRFNDVGARAVSSVLVRMRSRRAIDGASR